MPPALRLATTVDLEVLLPLMVDQHNHAAQELYAALGYRKRDRYFLMSKSLTTGN